MPQACLTTAAMPTHCTSSRADNGSHYHLWVLPCSESSGCRRCSSNVSVTIKDVTCKSASWRASNRASVAETSRWKQVYGNVTANLTCRENGAEEGSGTRGTCIGWLEAHKGRQCDATRTCTAILCRGSRKNAKYEKEEISCTH